MKTLPIKALQEVLRALVEVSVDTGVADDTSLVTRLDDSAKAWPVNAFTDLIVEITAGTGVDQIRKIASNTATSLVPVTNFATAPDATSQYRIGFYGKMTSDIASWGGTGLTGRDVTLDLKALTDDSIKGLLKSIGDIAALENLITRIGQTTDAMVAAGAAGSVAAKLRRVTQGLEDLKTTIVLAAGTALIGKVGIDQTTPGTTNKVTGDITHVGGTAVTGRDISLDLKTLTDDSVKGLLKSIGDIAALENLITRIGQTSDAIVAAGAAGSMSAKLRRATQGLEDLKTLIALSQLPAALTAAGNLKLSVEERLILKTIRDIAPGATGTFWLPDTGNIDLSKYLSSSWGIYAPTTATMVINCYLNISHDGGTTWRRAAGYEILDADFVRDVWNTIDCPLKLAEAKLEVVITTAYPAELDLMCIAKP